MPAARSVSLVRASAALALALAVPLRAQSPTHNAKGGNGHKSNPPSSSPLPGPTGGASPLAWVDDASLLAPGSMSLTVSAMRWSGADLSEVDFPIIDAQVGLTKRFQMGASVPRIFAATGFFSRGAWFAGGGAGFQLSPRAGASVSFTRSWAKTDVTGVNRDRRELSGGVSYFVKPFMGVYGSTGHTIGTTDENGAGMSVSGGVTFLLNPRITQ